MRRFFVCSAVLATALAFLPGGVSAFQEEGTLRIGGIWALSGPAAYVGSSSNGLSSLAIVRRLADSDKVLFSLGPTCSNVAEPVFGTLQKRLDDPNDTGLQFLFFTDTAIKFGLAKISPWAFRNVGNEPAVFDLTFQLVKEKYPDLKTAAAYESDFAHSVSTWKGAVKPALEQYGYQVLDVVEWRFEDTEFGPQTSKLRKLNPDILVMLSHTYTTCGSMKEFKRQRVKSKLMVGITCTANTETMTAGWRWRA